MLNTTIVALATPFMESAIAVIRLSGKDAIKIINELFTKDLTNVKSWALADGNGNVFIAVNKRNTDVTIPTIIYLNKEE